MLSASLRALLKALLFSLILHGVLLTWLVPWEPPFLRPVPGILHARLQPGKSGSPAQPAPVAQPQPRPQASTQAPPRMIKQAPSPVSGELPESIPNAVSDAKPSGLLSRGPKSGVLEATAPEVSTASGAQADPLPPGRGGDPDALREFRMALARAARAARHYPATAREQGLEGVVRLRLSWRQGLPMPLVSLQQGSGHLLLDEAALEMLRQALAATPVPRELPAFDLVLPVEFSLGPS